MGTVGNRLMLLGALLLGGVIAYFAVDQPSAAKLETDNFIREINNRQVSAGLKDGLIDLISAEERLGARRRLALWPAGMGFLLLGIGWAVGASNKKADD
ncbi:hypothetical protein [Stenotrophomonas maltophilia]|uniref:hypothetical protein n=1 Tax=Stenotrophomonas maltophilia TaxID=40324 RepID=UPI0013DA5296|nr:hypothetical protein [Stenotrophomonas maltophilia]